MLLGMHVEKLVGMHGLSTIGFLTFTFPDHVTDAKEAGRRFNSLLTNVVRTRYRDYVAVLERMRNLRIHYHLLVPVGSDIRTGVDFDAIRRKDYRSASPVLRNEWAFWRKAAPRYRFGRTELLPIKSTEAAIKFYVGKYISKHIENRVEADKGVRLVRTSFHAKAGTTRFAWNSIAARLWREKVHLLLKEANLEETECIGKAFGRRWMFKHQDIVQSVSPPLYWSESAAELDSIPPGMERAERALKFFEEHGALRMTAREALLAIGDRTERRRRRSSKGMPEELEHEARKSTAV